MQWRSVLEIVVMVGRKAPVPIKTQPSSEKMKRLEHFINAPNEREETADAFTKSISMRMQHFQDNQKTRRHRRVRYSFNLTQKSKFF